MEKSVKSFRLSDEVRTLLKKLAEKNSRTETNMVEVLIKEAAKKADIKR